MQFSIKAIVRNPEAMFCTLYFTRFDIKEK